MLSVWNLIFTWLVQDTHVDDDGPLTLTIHAANKSCSEQKNYWKVVNEWQLITIYFRMHRPVFIEADYTSDEIILLNIKMFNLPHVHQKIMLLLIMRISQVQAAHAQVLAASIEAYS